MPELEAASIVAVLNRHRVKYVVIGAFAAIAQGAPIRPTLDIDFAPQTSRDNLDRLSAALRELGARIRAEGVPEGLAFSHDGASLGRGSTWNLTCEHGEFDLCCRPAGFDGGYDDLAPRAHRVQVENIKVFVADLDDVIRSKEAAGRPKDLQVLPALYAFRASMPPANKPGS